MEIIYKNVNFSSGKEIPRSMYISFLHPWRICLLWSGLQRNLNSHSGRGDSYRIIHLS